MNETHIVICTDDGVYYLATRQVFPTRDAAETYAATVNASRQPLVVTGRFHQLRLPAETHPYLASYGNRDYCQTCGEHRDRH